MPSAGDGGGGPRAGGGGGVGAGSRFGAYYGGPAKTKKKIGRPQERGGRPSHKRGGFKRGGGRPGAIRATHHRTHEKKRKKKEC